MDFVNDQQTNLLHIGAVLPVARDAIPFLWGADDDVSRQQGAQVRREVSSQFYHLLAQSGAQALPPIIHALTHQCLHFVSMMALYSLFIARLVRIHLCMHTHVHVHSAVNDWRYQRVPCVWPSVTACSIDKSLDQHSTKDELGYTVSPLLLSAVAAKMCRHCTQQRRSSLPNMPSVRAAHHGKHT